MALTPDIFIGILFDILIFCDSYRAGDGQKVLFDTVIEYSSCKYLESYLNGKCNRQYTQRQGCQKDLE